MKSLNALMIAALFGLVSGQASGADSQKEQPVRNKASSEDAFCKTLRQTRPNAVCGANNGKASSEKFNEVLNQARPNRPGQKASSASQSGMAR